MVLKNKIKKEIDRDKIISRAGHVTADIQETNKKNWTNICLRITTDMIRSIDILLEERIGISRTAWILEAIQEKLKGEK